MPKKTKLVTATAFTLALAAGGIAGAALGVPSVSDAQTTDDTTTDTTTPDTTTDDSSAPTPPDGFRGRPGPGGPGGHKLDTAAEALGMSADDLRTALEGGQTIAEVAAANGVGVQTVIDALVAEATEHITDFVNNGPPERPAAD